MCAPASQAPVERLFSISGHILSQRRLRTTDKNFENILFANVNYEVFDAELRKRKQPDSDDNNQWWSNEINAKCLHCTAELIRTFSGSENPEHPERTRTNSGSRIRSEYFFSFGVRSELADSVVRKIPNPEKIYRWIKLNIFHLKLYQARPEIHSG